MRTLTGENLKVVRAEFSTLRWAVCVTSVAVVAKKSMPTFRAKNSAQVLTCKLIAGGL